MPLFRYEAITPAGATETGTRSAELVAEVEQWLFANGKCPVSIQIVSEEEAGQAKHGADKPSLKDRLQGITIEDRILFCRQIATMLGAGVPVLQALKIMFRQIANRQLRQILTEVAAGVESGSSLSDSFSRYPKVFNQLFLNVIRVGEESGSLDNSFNYLTLLYENEKDIRERIKAATRYPKIVITAMFAAVFFLMSFVVPKFVNLFAKSNVVLPLPTRLLIVVSNAFAQHWLAILVALAVIGFSYRMAMNYEEFVLFRDRLLLKTPILSDLHTKIYMSRFCRVFAVLNRSGIDIIKTLRLSATALENLVLFRMIEEVTAEVEQGVSIHEAMDKHPQLPAMVVQMLAVGEESGQIDTMMDKVADYYAIETDYTIKNLSTMIEPILLFFMGILVAFIALAIFMPMWNMMNVMRGGH